MDWRGARQGEAGCVWQRMNGLDLDGKRVAGIATCYFPHEGQIIGIEARPEGQPVDLMKVRSGGLFMRDLGGHKAEIAARRW